MNLISPTRPAQTIKRPAEIFSVARLTNQALRLGIRLKHPITHEYNNNILYEVYII